MINNYRILRYYKKHNIPYELMILIESLPISSGIYCIKNIINNNFYIGSAQNIKHRIKIHLHTLIRGKHQNKYLQNSFNKNGLNNFEFGILENKKYRDNNYLREIEEKYINKLKPKFNLSKTTKHVTMSKKSLESMKNKKSKEYIIQFPDGHEEKIRNLEKFCRLYKLNSGHMGQVVQGRLGQNKGFKARYADEKLFRFKNKVIKEYIIIEPNNNKVKIINLSKYCKSNNLNPSAMSAVANGRYSKHKGFGCFYV